MFEKLKTNWRELLSSEPGKRFRERYRRLQRKRSGRLRLKKVIHIFSGIVVILIGMFFWLIPGSGWLIIIIGAGIIAGESRTVARCMDWAELKIRSMIQWAREKWDHNNFFMKLLIGLFVIIIIILIGYFIVKISLIFPIK